MASVMPAMAIISLVPVMPLLGREFGAVNGSAFLIPVALTVPALCVAIFSPLAGWLSDRLGRKWLLVAALVLYSAIGIVPYFLNDLHQIIGARIGLGIAEAVIMTVATAMIGDYFVGKQRERWVAAQVAVVSVSAIVLIAVGGMLGEVLGWRGPFLMYLLALPIALIVTLVLFEPDEKSEELDRNTPLPFIRILPLLVLTLFVGILFYTTIVKLGPILALTGEVSSGTIGMIGAAVNTGVMIGAIVFGRFKSASGPLLLTLGLSTVAIGYLGMGLSQTLLLISVFAVITTIGAGFLLPTLLNWILQVLPESVRGRGTGLWTGMFFLGQFVAPILASAVQGPMDGLANVLLTWAALSLLAGLACNDCYPRCDAFERLKARVRLHDQTSPWSSPD